MTRTARLSTRRDQRTSAARPMSADEIFAELVARGLCTAAKAAEAGHPVTDEGRRRRSYNYAKSSDADVRAAFEAGRLHGLDEADQELIAGLARMLGTEKTTSIRQAALWHDKDQCKAELRRRSDAGDPDLMAEAARERERVAAANRQRDRDCIAAAERIPPVRGWEAWREFCNDSVWERIVAEYAAVGRPLPQHLVSSRRRLRVAA